MKKYYPVLSILSVNISSRPRQWSLNKMFSLLFHFPLPPLTYSLPPCSHLAFFPRASLSVSQSTDATEKRVEVNSLSPCLINNVTPRLTEWVWMAAAGMKWLEYFLNYQHRRRRPPRSAAWLVWSRWQILVWPCAVFLFCLFPFGRVSLPLFLRHCWRFSWARKCFLVKEPCNRITLRMCFGVESACVLRRLLREFQCRQITDTAMHFTCVLSSSGMWNACVLTCWHSVHTCMNMSASVCVYWCHGVHTLHWELCVPVHC